VTHASPQPLLRVLHIEDSPDDAELVGLVLRRADLGAVVEKVETLEEARQALSTQRWDLVLSDFNLPGFDAWHVLELLEQISPHLPCIVVSGAVGEETAVKLLHEGAVDFVNKGSLGRLVPAIGRALREAALERSKREAEEALKRTNAELERRLEQLRASEEFKNRMIASSNDCIKVLDLQGRLLSMNQGGQELLGIKNFDLFLCRNWLTFWNSQEQARAEQALDAARAGGVGRFEGFFPTLRGEAKWWDVVISPIRNAYGVPERLLAVSRDVTEQRLTKEALRQREQDLQVVLTNAPDIIARFDRHYRHLYVNSAIERVTGRPAGEFIGKTNRELGMPQEAVDAWDAALERVFVMGEESSLEFGFGASEELWFQTRLVPVRSESGAVETVLGISRDVTKQRQAELALRESEQQLKLALQAGKLGAWQLDLASMDLSASAQCKANFGFPADAPFTYETLFECIVPEEREQVHAAVLASIERKQPYEVEYRVIWPDGSAHWIMARGHCLYDRRGKPQRMLGFTLDITALKQVESERRRMELEQALANQAVEERRRIGQELHDNLLQQLVGIRMLAASLYRKLNPSLGPDAETLQEFVRLLGDANTEVRRLMRGLVPTQVKAESLEGALQRIGQNVRQWYGLPCTIRYGSSVQWSDEVANHLFHVVQEAVFNAAKHSHCSQVTVVLEERLGETVVRIEDDGVGLLEGYEHLGSLGLASMRHRVELMGGQLRVEPGAVGGTVIQCLIPTSVPS
jgi:PAS domain S-box-containing protein